MCLVGRYTRINIRVSVHTYLYIQKQCSFVWISVAATVYQVPEVTRRKFRFI